MSAAPWGSLTVVIRMIQLGPRPLVMGRNPPQVHRPSGGDNPRQSPAQPLSRSLIFTRVYRGYDSRSGEAALLPWRRLPRVAFNWDADIECHLGYK